MTRLRTALAVLAIVAFVVGCDDFGIGAGDLASYKVTVTNAGSVPALITIAMPDGSKTVTLAPGFSAAQIGYKAVRYALTVHAVDDIDAYRANLGRLRSELEKQLGAGVGDPATVLSQITLIKQQQRALQASTKSFGCSGEVTKLKPYKIGSIAFQAAGTAGIWVPTCG